MNVKKIMTAGLAVTLIVTSLDYPVYADNKSNQSNYTNLSGYHAEFDPEAKSLDRDGTLQPSKAGRLAEVPAVYNPIEDNSTMPDLRDQNPYGTCWAFSSIALAEMSLLRKENKLIDLSELHLVYYTNSTLSDPLGGTDGDTNGVPAGENMLYIGGNQSFAMQTLAAWKGAETEAKVPYSSAYYVVQNGLDSSYAFDDVAHLKNGYIININSDADEAKKLIMENGAISVSYNSQKGTYDDVNNSYYCSDTKAGIDHAVTIVGWDDDFSNSKFEGTEKPSGNGAWLVRNSWGGSGYSYSGYFWLSYYDKSLSGTAYAFEFVSDQNSKDDEFYDNNYQYDGGAYSGIVYNYNKAANVFRAQRGHETLKAISFGTADTNEKYTVKIYKDLTSAENPESGILVSTTTGSTTFEGMYTVKLATSVDLKYGDKYSVVVELSGADETSFLREVPISAGFFESTTDSKEGQSFLYINYASKWSDCTNDNINDKGNIRIKAYTDTIDDNKTVVPESDLAVVTDADTFYMDKINNSVSFTTKVMNTQNNTQINYDTVCELSQEAINQGYKVEMNEDGTYTLSYEGDSMSPSQSYNMRVYAVDYNGDKTSVYKDVAIVVQKPKIEDCTIDILQKDWTYSGVACEPRVSVYTRGQILTKGIDYDISYSNNVNAGTATVTITGKNSYRGTATKTFTIAKSSKYISMATNAYEMYLDSDPCYLNVLVPTGESLLYTSSNPNIVKVDANGLITPMGTGDAVITISSPESNNYFAAQDIQVYVRINGNSGSQNPSDDGNYSNNSDDADRGGSDIASKAAKSITVRTRKYNKVYGAKAFSLGAGTCTGETLKYLSSDRKVAVVNSAGKVTIKGTGIAVITITSPESTRYNAAEPVKITIKVAPKAVSILSAKNIKGKKIKAAWKADKNASGYQIVYSLKKNFKNSKVVTIKSNKTTRMVIKKLKKGRTYYVRIRAYKTSKGRKIYGAYSKIIKTNIKK